MSQESIKIGLHRDLPAHIYHSIPYASASHLKDLMECPLRCAHGMSVAKNPTPDMIFGDAVHLATFQPHLLRERYTVADQCQGTTGKGTQCSKGGAILRGKKWYCKQHDPERGAPALPIKTLSQDKFDHVLVVAESVRKNRYVQELLEDASEVEVSGIWRDDRTGVMCKLRADMLVRPKKIIADLKTTTDASEEGFAAAIWNYGYQIQGAHYLRGLAAIDQIYDEFWFIAVEKDPPYLVSIYRMKADAIMGALDELDALLQIWKECEANNGTGWSKVYNDGVVTIGIPAWAGKRQEERLESLKRRLKKAA